MFAGGRRKHWRFNRQLTFGVAGEILGPLSYRPDMRAAFMLCGTSTAIDGTVGTPVQLSCPLVRTLVISDGQIRISIRFKYVLL